MNLLKLCTFLVLVTGYSVANGQTILTAKDIESNELIPFFSVYYIDYQFGEIADSVGRVIVSDNLKFPLRVKVSASGFETEIITINDKSIEFTIDLFHEHLDIDEVSVSSPKGGVNSKDATHIEHRKLNSLNEIAVSNLGEALKKIPGVYTSDAGSGVSKPVLRGFQGLRVVSLINGVRLENQQWGGDHDFGITDLAIGSVEVIKGPASLLYGADALGGVLYFNDEEYAQQNTIIGRVQSQYETNTNGFKNDIILKYSKGNVRLNVAGNYFSHADFQLPNSKFVSNSRFGGYAGKFSLGAHKKNWVTHIRYMYSNSSVGIIGHHEEEEGEGIIEEIDEFESTSQLRSLKGEFQKYENHIASFENKFFGKNSEWMLLLSHSYNNLAELEEDIENPAMGLKLNNSTLNLRYKKKLSSKLNLVSGFVSSIQTNTNTGAEEQLIPNSHQFDNGLYAIVYLNVNKWNIQAGGRYDYRFLKTFASTHFGSNHEFDFKSPNFSIGAVHGTKKSTLKINLTSGFRVPHLSELIVDGEHHGASRYEKGNIDLIPERAFQLDVSEEIHGNHVEFVLNPFFSYIQNYIYLNETDSIIDNLVVYEYEQTSASILTGADVAMHYHPHFAHWLHWEPSFSFIYGQDMENKAIPFMPQTRVMNNVKFNFNVKSKLEIENLILQHSYYFDQNRVSGLETKSKGYNLINAGINFKYSGKQTIRLSIGVKNLFNERYIDHLSRLKNLNIQNTGRNFYAKLVIGLEGKLKSK